MDRHWRYSTEALQEEAGVPLIEEFSQRIVETFFHKVLFPENPLILGLIDPKVYDSTFAYSVLCNLGVGRGKHLQIYIRNMVFCKFSMNRKKYNKNKNE
jgi:hypothetical protein